MNPRIKKIFVPVIAVLAGFVLGAIIMLVFGYNPIYGYEDMFAGALGTPSAIGNTVQTMGPLILEALGFAIAMKAGLFNIGMAGQAMAGWVMAMWFALSFPNIPYPLMIPLVLIIGMFFGALMGFIPGVLKALLGTSEVITTIMMNYIILYIANAFLSIFPSSIMQANSGQLTKSVGANASFKLSWMSALTDNSTLNIGIFFALIALVVMALVMKKTTFGFEINAVGLNPDASEYAGISAKRTIILTMVVAGVLAGLGGVVYGFGYMTNFTQQTTTLDIGFNGLVVALLGENDAIGILFSALLFSILETGAANMANIDSIPPQITQVVTAAIIFFIAIKFVIEHVLPAAKNAKAAKEVAS